MSKICSICKKAITADEPAILTMGPYGAPKYLCDECEGDFETVTLGKDVDEIGEAMGRIGDKMADNELIGKLVLNTVDGIFEAARDRAEQIKEGSYDFSLDTPDESEDSDGVPEELLESEEDRALDEKERTKNEKLDKLITWIGLALIAGVSAYIVYLLITRLFL